MFNTAMGKRAQNKVFIGLWVDSQLRDGLDQLGKLWGFENRSEVVNRLLRYSCRQMERMGTRESRAAGN